MKAPVVALASGLSLLCAGAQAATVTADYRLGGLVSYSDCLLEHCDAQAIVIYPDTDALVVEDVRLRISYDSPLQEYRLSDRTIEASYSGDAIATLRYDDEEFVFSGPGRGFARRTSYPEIGLPDFYEFNNIFEGVADDGTSLAFSSVGNNFAAPREPSPVFAGGLGLGVGFRVSPTDSFRLTPRAGPILTLIVDGPTRTSFAPYILNNAPIESYSLGIPAIPAPMSAPLLLTAIAMLYPLRRFRMKRSGRAAAAPSGRPQAPVRAR